MATLADQMIGNLLNAGGLIGDAFAQGRQNDLAQQQGQQQLQLGRMQMAAEQARQARQQQYQQDVAAYSANPTPQALSGLMARYPDQADAIKKSYDVLDAPARESRLSQLGSLYYASSNNRPDLAAGQIGGLISAEKAQGHDTSEAEQIQAALQSGDEATRTAALTQLKAFTQAHLAIADPKAAEAIIGKDESYTLNPGDARFKNGQMVAHSPFVKGADDAVYSWDSLNGKGGGPASAGGSAGGGSGAPPGMTPAVASVASTLSGSLPAPVVAGFLGNFHVEGGYTGAQGDGGSASGIAQWHNDRAANFQRVIGKPVIEATPADQAKFVLYEMQHPQEAGMTVKQRDAILNAKTPAQAAALIDQYYERSDGKARAGRIQAAQAFSNLGGAQQSADDGSDGDSPKPLIPGKKKDPPSGYQWAADSKTLQPIPGGPADDSGDQGLIDLLTAGLYADQILSGGQMPAFGMGKEAAKARAMVMREVAKRAGADGMTGADLAAQIAHYKAGTKALSTLENQFGTVQASERTALANGQQFLDRSNELGGQTRFPLINSVTQSYLRNTGDPTISASDAAWNTFTTEYAKVVAGSPSGSGTLSDSARHEAQATMRSNASPAQKAAAFAQMKADMSNRIAAYRSSIADGYSNLTKRPTTGNKPSAISPVAPRSAASIPTLTPAQVAQAPSGTMFRTTDGRTMKKR